MIWSFRSVHLSEEFKVHLLRRIIYLKLLLLENSDSDSGGKATQVMKRRKAKLHKL